MHRQEKHRDRRDRVPRSEGELREISSLGLGTRGAATCGVAPLTPHPSKDSLMRPWFPVVVAVLASLAGTACAATEEGDESAHESMLVAAPSLGPAAVSRWEAYVQRETSGVSLQEGCAPRRFAPRAGMAPRGVVVLFHGFTACPQQFFEIAAELNTAGYDVLLPLLPGHGRQFRVVDGKRKDDIASLPTGATRERYSELAEEMTAIASEARYDRVVGGLSMGGMVATSALVQGQNFRGASTSVWTRGILFAPFFGPPGVSGWASRVGGMVAPGAMRSWGPECERSTVPGKRAGICEFTLGNLQAGTSLGEDLLRSANTVRVPVQLVGVEADTAADNGEMAKLVRSLGGKKDACFYAKGMPHAFISKNDHFELDHAWLPALHRGITSFVRNGTPFPTQGLSSEHGHGLCAPR
jgi:alpha-beta hydrolase superfamily lysophospholipase